MLGMDRCKDWQWVMTFIHRFSRSLTCTIHVADKPPAKGNLHIQAIQWTGQPKPKHTREYIRWCHVVHSHLADLWNIRLLHAVQTGPKLWEFWAYEPGQPPKRMDSCSQP